MSFRVVLLPGVFTEVAVKRIPLSFKWKTLLLGLFYSFFHLKEALAFEEKTALWPGFVPKLMMFLRRVNWSSTEERNTIIPPRHCIVTRQSSCLANCGGINCRRSSSKSYVNSVGENEK